MRVQAVARPRAFFLWHGGSVADVESEPGDVDAYAHGPIVKSGLPPSSQNILATELAAEEETGPPLPDKLAVVVNNTRRSGLCIVAKKAFFEMPTCHHSSRPE